MKKILFLLFSGLVFGQNIELLQNIQKGDENTPAFLAEKVLPEYKLVHTYKLDSLYGDEITYVYLPSSTPEEKVLEYNQGGYDFNAVTLSYMVNGKFFTFVSAKGKCEKLLPFWKKEIQPNTIIVEGHRDNFSYKNPSENIDYYLTASDTKYSTCNFTNMKSKN